MIFMYNRLPTPNTKTRYFANMHVQAPGPKIAISHCTWPIYRTSSSNYLIKTHSGSSGAPWGAL